MFRRGQIVHLTAIAVLSAVATSLTAAAQVADVTAGAVVIQGTATASQSLGSPLSSPLTPACDFFAQTMQWHVEAQGVAGGVAAVVDLGGNAFPPSGVSASITITTCQSWWFGGPPVDLLAQPSSITGTIQGSATNGSTFSCGLTGTDFSYDAGVVGMGGKGQCLVDGAPLTVLFGFSGEFVPTTSSATTTVAGALSLQSLP